MCIGFGDDLQLGEGRQRGSALDGFRWCRAQPDGREIREIRARRCGEGVLSLLLLRRRRRRRRLREEPRVGKEEGRRLEAAVWQRADASLS
jgi:hypothetical protein